MSLKYFTFVVLMWATSALAKQEPVCPDNSWSMSKSSNGAAPLCFKVVYKKVPSFEEGEQLCAAIGAKAAPFRSEADKLAIQESIKKIKMSGKNVFSNVYIGLNDVAPSLKVPAKYEWKMTGEKLGTFNYWRQGEPNRYLIPANYLTSQANAGHYEKCVSIMLNEDLHWLDITCDLKLVKVDYDNQGIVCAREPQIADPTMIC